MTRFIRVWLPVIICLGGIAALIIEPNINGLEGAAMIVGAGLSVWLFNWLFRVGVEGDKERDQEDEARAFFDRHGVWPDEVPPGVDLDAPAPPQRPSDPHRRTPRQT